LKIAHEEKNIFASKASKQKREFHCVKLWPLFVIDLSAENEDSKVYENCNGVVVMVNPAKEWTFSYAKDILEGIPETIEVLVLVIHP
jgi:hypothetical protein